MTMTLTDMRAEETPMTSAAKPMTRHRNRSGAIDRLEYHAVVAMVFVPTLLIESIVRIVRPVRREGSAFASALSVARTAAGYAFKL